MKRFLAFILSVFLVLGLAGLASGFTSLSPLDVYNNMQLYPGDSAYIGYLIDVRTPQEWSGLPFTIGATSGDTPGHPGYDGTNGAFLEDRVFNISYMLYDSAGTRILNDDFAWEFQNRYSFVTDEPFALLCHSGVRSYNAATLLDALDDSIGESWTIYNVLGGFEGRTGIPSIYCPSEDCPGWIDTWFGFSDGLPHVDNVSAGAYSPVPEPCTLLLLGSGLVGLTGFRRKFKK
ncbi:MAG: PEP-CTERM sorting domain-containing protein [Thermodesulfobacteriota bacterium]|nr:PEP-CTERM sorting domain-containing protein [Thermodesulfobacteriota bacterium]